MIIKFNVMELSAPCKSYTLSLHAVRVKHSEFGHVADQINGKEVQTSLEAKTLTLHTSQASRSGRKVRY